MSGQHGVSELIKLVELGAEAANVAFKVADKEGAFVVFQLSDELMALSSVDQDALKKQFGELDKEDRAQVRAAFAAKLVLKNKDLEGKIEKATDLLDEGIELLFSILSYGSKVQSFVKA